MTHAGAVGDYIAYAYNPDDTLLDLNTMQSKMLPDGTCVDGIEVFEQHSEWGYFSQYALPAYEVVDLAQFQPPFRFELVRK